MKYLMLVALILVSVNSAAECRVHWVDHDYNASTLAIQKQVCDSTLDIPGINLPGVRPIQEPQIKPIESLDIPPIGTTRCRTESVYDDGEWVDIRLCD